MIALLHLWHDAGAPAAIQLVLVMLTVGAIGALHVWLLRHFETGRPPPTGGHPEVRGGIAALRSLRRERHAARSNRRNRAGPRPSPG